MPEARLRPGVVVVVPPRGDDLASFPEIQEDVLIKALIAKFGVEALDKSVLYRLAGLDVPIIWAIGKAPGSRPLS